MPIYRNYRWIIKKDHLGYIGPSRVGTQGPADYNEGIKDNPAAFSMYDDDKNIIYEGMLYGDYDGFEPLDDFGAPDAGCTMIKIDGKWL